MKTYFTAAVVASALVLGATGVMAQATPPVGDPTAQSAETPKQKVDNGTAPAKAPTGTTTQTTGSGAATNGGGTAPSGTAK